MKPKNRSTLTAFGRRRRRWRKCPIQSYDDDDRRHHHDSFPIIFHTFQPHPPYCLLTQSVLLLLPRPYNMLSSTNRSRFTALLLLLLLLFLPQLPTLFIHLLYRIPHLLWVRQTCPDIVARLRYPSKYWETLRDEKRKKWKYRNFQDTQR